MKKLTKRVQADGLWFDVPADTASVMVNAFGQVLAISIGVVLSKGEHNWVIEHGIDDFVCPVGSVDLDGADWRECCWYVGDQADSKPKEQPVAWMAIYHGEVHDDAIGLTQAAVVSQTERFGWEPSLTEIIPLYSNPPPEQMQRRGC